MKGWEIMKKYQFNVLKTLNADGKVWLYAKVESTISGDFVFLKLKPQFINYAKVIPMLVEQLDNGVWHTMQYEEVEDYEVVAELQFDTFEEVDYMGFAGSSINHEGSF